MEVLVDARRKEDESRCSACISPSAKHTPALVRTQTRRLRLPSPLSPPVTTPSQRTPQETTITGVSNPLIRFSYLPYKPYIHIHHTTAPSSASSPPLPLLSTSPLFFLFFKTPDAVQATTPPSPRRVENGSPDKPTGREPLENAQKQTERRKPFPPAFAMLKPCFRECARAETRTERRAAETPPPPPTLSPLHEGNPRLIYPPPVTPAPSRTYKIQTPQKKNQTPPPVTP